MISAGSLTVNLVAVALFFALWIGYEVLFDGPRCRPNSLNAKMPLIRAAWMARLLERENLIVDSALVGNSLHTATFFASTTILILAGLVGVFGSSERVYGHSQCLSQSAAS